MGKHVKRSRGGRIVPAVIIAALLFVVLAQSRRLRALKKAPEKAPGPAEES